MMIVDIDVLIFYYIIQ